MTCADPTVSTPLSHSQKKTRMQGSATPPQTRPAELERALRAFHESKARIPHHLYRPPLGGRGEGGGDGAPDGERNGGVGGGSGGAYLVKTRRELKAQRIGQRGLFK